MNKQQIKKMLKHVYNRLMVKKLWRHEIKKYSCKERKEIYSRVHLTSEQKKNIDQFFQENYGKKIPYIWHRHFTAFTGRFDETYLPEAIYIAEFEYYMNEGAYKSAVSDKNVAALLARAVGVASPAVYISRASGVFRDANYNVLNDDQAMNIIANIKDGFIKPTVDSGSGKNCALLEMNDGVDKFTKNSAKEIFSAYGSDFVIQRKLFCCDELRKLYPESVNTFRIITYRWNEKIYHMPIALRIGQGGNYLDNAHAGGMFIAVMDDGRLGEFAYTEFCKVYKEHPDTGVVFAGYKINGLDKIIKSAYAIHAAIPQVGVINFDFTIDAENNPVLIEANTKYGGIWLPQMAHGKGVLGENAVDILRWLKAKRKMVL